MLCCNLYNLPESEHANTRVHNGTCAHTWARPRRLEAVDETLNDVRPRRPVRQNQQTTPIKHGYNKPYRVIHGRKT